VLQFLRENSFIVGALSGSMAAYLLGLLISFLRREKRRLVYSVESRSIVKVGDSRISIKFENRDIQRLDSHIVIIRNIGNRALTALPIQIVLKDSGQIVEYEVLPPDGANYQVQQLTSGQINLICDLLNPGEAAGVGLTVADSTDDGEVRVLARAEGLTVRRIGERSTSTELLDLFLESSSITKAVIDIASILTGGRRLTRK
jgi:hypothetical protein